DNSDRNYKIKKMLFTGIENMTIVTPSKWLFDTVKETYLKDYPINVINNGVDLNVFKQRKSVFRLQYGLEGKYIILGVASIWNERKGYQYFVDISRKLNADERVVLVGVDERLISRLPRGIIGILKTNNPLELAEIYSASDVFINPTLEDNFPTTNLEALACGTPVITFNSGGSPECLNEECGIVVPRGDKNGLVNAIRLIRKKSKIYYTPKCQKRVVDYYDKDDCFEEYIDLYKKLS
ncbi:MAG: glycosyltransferase, partial [Syntrophaceae bacterium]|nr:glycosyltransferase [Syntrophaceae bacterium]